MKSYPTPIELIYWIILFKKIPLLEWRNYEWGNMPSYPISDVIKLIDDYAIKDEYYKRLHELKR